MSIEWGDLPVTAAPTRNEWDDAPAGANDWGDTPAEPSPYSLEGLAAQSQRLVQTIARARQLREEHEKELARPKYFVGIRPNLGGIGLPQVGMDKPLVQFQVPEELVAFGGEAVKSSPSAAAGLAAASAAMPAGRKAGTAISVLPIPGAPLAGRVVQGAVPLVAGGAAAMGVRFGQEQVLPEILPEDLARSYQAAGQAAAGSPTSAMLGQFAGTLPFFRPGLPIGTEPGSRLAVPAVSGVIGGGIEGAQQAARGEFDPQQLAIATLGSALLNRETRLGQRVGPNLVLREAQTSVLPDELIPVGQAMREPLPVPEPSLPSPTMTVPSELAPVAAARAEAGAEIAAAAAQRAALESAESQARIRALGERMMGKTPQDQLQILDQEMRLQKDYLNEAEQRAGLDLKQELKRQIDAQKAMEEAATAQAKAAADQEKAVADAQKAIEEAQQPPEMPESARILAEPVTKTPSIANVATEVATQTKDSPYALQAKLNEMTAVPENNLGSTAIPEVRAGNVVGQNINEGMGVPILQKLDANDFPSGARGFDENEVAALEKARRTGKIKVYRAVVKGQPLRDGDFIGLKRGDVEHYADNSNMEVIEQYVSVDDVHFVEGVGVWPIRYKFGGRIKPAPQAEAVGRPTGAADPAVIKQDRAEYDRLQAEIKKIGYDKTDSPELQAGGVPPIEAAVSPQKTQAIRQAVANPLTKWQYTVFRPGEGYPSAIQVDAIEGTANTVSSNVADLNAAGAKLPEVPDWVPQGQYSVEEIRAFIKQGEPRTAFNPVEPPKTPSLISATLDDIDKWDDAVRRFDKNIDSFVLGEDLAKEYRRNERVANSSMRAAGDPAVKKAEARMAEIEAMMTPEQQAIFYGQKLPQGYIDPEQSRMIRNAVEDIDLSKSVTELARTNSKLIQRVLRSASSGEQIGITDSELFARLTNRLRQLKASPQDLVTEYMKHRSKYEGADVFELAGTTPQQLAQFLSQQSTGAQPNALQIEGPTGLLQRQSLEAGATGSERGRVEPVIEGETPPRDLVRQEPVQEPRSAEQRLNDAGIGLPAISSLSAKQKLAELKAGGVTSYKGKPIEDANPAQLSAALGQYRRGQLGSERGSVPTNVLAPIGGAAGGAATGFVSTERQPGESDEEFFARRMRNTLVGGIVGSGGAVATHSFASNVMNRAKSRAQSLKAIQQEATGREAMPDWYIRLRQTPAGVAVREAINNNRVRVKDLVTAVSKDAKVPESANPYLTGKLYPGRVSERIRQAEDTMRGVQDSIITAAKASGMPEQDFINRFNLWMEARHTPFYNAMLRERHDVPGTEPPRHRFTDEQAADILAETGKDGYAKVFEDLDRELRGVTEATRDMLAAGGIIDEAAVREWRKIYPNYVPFNRIFPEDTAEKAAEIVLGGGPGLNVLGTGVYGIKGSDLPVADISGSIYGNFIDAIRRVEKNRVDLSAVEFFQGPGKGIPGIRVKIPTPMEHFNPNTMVAARKDGQRVWIEFDDPKLATAFSNLNPEAQTGLLKLISYPTRWFSQLVTRFNPNFLAANPLRDRQEAALKLASQGDWEGAAKAINPATTLYKDPKAVVAWMRDTGSPDALLFQQMLDDGGMAGGFASSTKKKAYDMVEEFRTSDVNVLVGAKDKFLKFVDVLTDISEGSTRLRAYRRALELGATRQEAALAARNASIDFNQKGTLTPQASALWAFINPATQGPINSAKALIRDPKTLAVIAAGFVGLDAAIDAWNSSYDPEWKKKPSFQFSRTSGIPVIYGVDEKTGELKTFSYPVAHALRPIKAVMDFSSDLARGQIDADNMDRELARVGGAVVDSTNPLGSSNIKTAWAPSVVRPALESWLNEKFTGSPIVPRWLEADPKIADTAKRYITSYDTATGRMANQLSDVAYQHGVDVSPERMRYLVTQYTGGPGRVVAGLINTSPEVIKAMQKSPDFEGIKASQVPVASAFFRRINPEISERETAEYRDTEEFVREAKTDEELRRQQARLFYRDYVEAIPAQNRAAFLRDAAQMGAIPEDPVYRNTLVSLLRSGMRDRDATDNLIGTLGVESGERARYYDTRLRAMKTQEERDAFLREQAQRGLLNRTVFGQLQQIAGAEN